MWCYGLQKEVFVCPDDGACLYGKCKEQFPYQLEKGDSMNKGSLHKVIDIDTARPHRTTHVECHICAHTWVAVYPETAKGLECPGCHIWVNEYGTPVYVNNCRICGREYSVCPHPDSIEDWQECLSEDCESYDPKRNADIYFEMGLVRRDDEPEGR